MNQWKTTKRKLLLVLIYFISRGNILNNIVNLPYGPQTIIIATKKHKKLFNVKKSEPRSGVYLLALV